MSSLAARSKHPAQRRDIVRSFNPHRNSSSPTTPLQVGNGDFAFGADITGLQTFSPFAIQSSWAWHNFSLPTTPGQTSPSDFTGVDWWTHGRLVNYGIPNPAEEDISNWLIRNPQRVNMGNIGLYFGGRNVTEQHLIDKTQDLDLWSGTIVSKFQYNGSSVFLQVTSHPKDPVLAIEIKSDLLVSGGLGVFFDFPYSDTNKFDAPYVGVWNETTNNTVQVRSTAHSASFKQIADRNVQYAFAKWSTNGSISGPLHSSNKFVLTPSGSDTLHLVVAFSPTDRVGNLPSYNEISAESQKWWADYWTSGAFIDLSATRNDKATELQRRIILSQYLVAVNSASHNPPQESGLVNNGWYGKFHLEMVLWHCLQFARWGHHDLLSRTVPGTYQRFLQSSINRAAAQGYAGARWGKMTDPTGKSAPGEINVLLIWQQPHVMHFAEYVYRAFPNSKTLREWDEIVTATADFMASYAWWNATTHVYDLGPPMYPVSENTIPNATVNPTFELAYWRFGLDVAIQWKERQGVSVPKEWVVVRDNLAPLPVINNTYAVYEGIPDMWKEGTATVQDHPAMAGIYGLLPPQSTGPPVNLTVMRNTAELIRNLWELEDVYGWDFSMLAMNSLRLGDVDQAVAYLLHPYYDFDDAGYPKGGERVPTPYFPNAGGLLLATAMMAGGWDGDEGPHFPADWNVTVEGFTPSL
ncbi:hypothetical protein ASPSYDRAFT_95869 [Aspergillus sydowii CBS 593.65]|uniref:Six-hairpin glycosidase-like protein n=1 Tax=Aspergillus sydowii CBS 593.65 TaxID=1036612 RepID=A0A1L9SYB6_9EURO|nr:uncharacterized protein ASPSYDRAFT_95869 [Aspergillus sydowii CBS 593.65]OJJ52178.1 hypothetical protein ASPSYDRAFT_95869 [Aspergillus sydowii CBS 593.65]